MRAFAPLVAVFLTHVALAAGPAETAIRQVLDAQVAAWNKGDLETFMAGYWKSDQVTYFSGGKRNSGWQTALDSYRKRYQGEGKEMGKLAFEELSVEPLGKDYALVRGRFRLKLSTGEKTGIFSLVFRHFPEGWKIIHDHTSA